MKRARVAYAGAIHEAVPHARGLQLADGRVVAEDAVVWLAPFEVGTIIALGLNYADHAKELSFGKQEEPLVFLKTSGSVVGHRGQTRRPKDVTFMHYECELAVVIGAPGGCTCPLTFAFEAACLAKPTQAWTWCLIFRRSLPTPPGPGTFAPAQSSARAQSQIAAPTAVPELRWIWAASAILASRNCALLRK